MQELSRREREKLSRRDEILQASWKVFSSKDYDSATIDDVAAAAELSKGTVYLYFRNKAELFLSTVEMGMGKLCSIIQESISSSSDPVAGLKEVIKRLLEFSEENVDFFKILSSEQSHFEIHSEMRNSCEFTEQALDSLARSTAILADYIQGGIEMDVFRQVNPTDAALVLLSIIHGLTTRRLAEPFEVSLPEKADGIASILLDGLRKR